MVFYWEEDFIIYGVLGEILRWDYFRSWVKWVLDYLDLFNKV